MSNPIDMRGQTGVVRVLFDELNCNLFSTIPARKRLMVEWGVEERLVISSRRG